MASACQSYFHMNCIIKAFLINAKHTDHDYFNQYFIWTQGDVLVPTQTHFVLLLKYRITFGTYLIVLNNFKSKMQDWSLRYVRYHCLYQLHFKKNFFKCCFTQFSINYNLIKFENKEIQYLFSIKKL